MKIFLSSILCMTAVLLTVASLFGIEKQHDEYGTQNEQTRAEELGRPIRWRQMGFNEGFFEPWDQLNTLGDLEPESVKDFVHLNDSIVVALDGWQQINEFPHSTALGINPNEIRSTNSNQPFSITPVRYVSAEGVTSRYQVMFVNMRTMAKHAPQECHAVIVIEAIRLIRSPEDEPKLTTEDSAIVDCAKEEHAKMKKGTPNGMP